MNKHMHFRTPGYVGNVAACNPYGRNEVTSLQTEVTCNNCRRTWLFKNHLKEQATPTNTVKLSELSNLRMVAGNEKKYDTVVIAGVVKQWVGIGWVGEDKATEADCKKYPVAID